MAAGKKRIALNDPNRAFRLRVVGWFQNALNRAGIDRKQLAGRYGARRQGIDQIMRGERDITLATLDQLANAAGFDMVIYFTPKPEPK